MYILYLAVRYGIPLILMVGFIGFIGWYIKAFNKSRAKRQESAVENLQRNGGQRKLEWEGICMPGDADQEYGSLVVEIPRKMGDSAKFYEYGLVTGKKRISYTDLKDVVVDEPLKETTSVGLKSAIRDCAKLWLYPNKGMAFGLHTVLGYNIELETMRAIKSGLGY